jgi:hypothetical protein
MFSLRPTALRTICKMATEMEPLTQSWFDRARFIPPDAIFALTAQYLADPSPRKVNLGQGTYRDENGRPWILPSVKKSREMLSLEGLNHEYLPIVGLAEFRKEAARLALGDALFAKKQNQVCTTLYLQSKGLIQNSSQRVKVSLVRVHCILLDYCSERVRPRCQRYTSLSPLGPTIIRCSHRLGSNAKVSDTTAPRRAAWILIPIMRH